MNDVSSSSECGQMRKTLMVIDWFERLLLLEKFFFKVAHECVCISGGNLGTHGCAE